MQFVKFSGHFAAKIFLHISYKSNAVSVRLIDLLAILKRAWIERYFLHFYTRGSIEWR